MHIYDYTVSIQALKKMVYEIYECLKAEDEENEDDAREGGCGLD